jgi:hypothetical protein
VRLGITKIRLKYHNFPIDVPLPEFDNPSSKLNSCAENKKLHFFRTRLYIRATYSHNIDRTELVIEGEGKNALSYVTHRATTAYGYVEPSNLRKTLSEVVKFGTQECEIKITITGKPHLCQTLKNSNNI